MECAAGLLSLKWQLVINSLSIRSGGLLSVVAHLLLNGPEGPPVTANQLQPPRDRVRMLQINDMQCLGSWRFVAQQQAAALEGP